MDIILINIILLIVIIFLLIVLSWVWPPDSPWAPWWKTSKEKSRAICRLANVSSKDIVYELGSGNGTTLIVAAKEFGAKGIGIEIDPLRVLVSKIKIWQEELTDKITIKRKNFFDEDLSKATVVYVYLVPKALERLKPKLLKELKKGTRLVSLNYEISLPLTKFDKKNNLRLYKIS
ncbi:MAG: SAM-dependent methyltransferase [Candidatus Levyibacteriota bacterium]|nr:MAG: SAM-dependent methyltransferase [Candidatus Levybacteria bacterium]